MESNARGNHADLAGQVVLITGGGSGIGAATAKLAAQCGAYVTVVGRRPDLLDETCTAIIAGGGQAHAHADDLADAASPRRIIEATLDQWGRLDGLVNNAATVEHRPLEAWDRDEFDRHLAVNIAAPYFLLQAASPVLRRSRGSVVNLSSSSGSLHRTGQSVYAMTKAALDYLTRSLAGELAQAGVRVNAIAPGPVDTPIHAQWADDLDEAYTWLRGQVPLGRIGRPDELARWIVLLLSPAASFVTGAVVPIDGGQTIDIS